MSIKSLLIVLALALPAATTGHALEVASEQPGIASNAHWKGQGLRLGNPAQFPAYAVGIVNEPVYAPNYAGSTFQLPTNDPYIHYDFVPLPSGLFQFQFALGRVQGDSYDKLFFGFTDSFQHSVPIDSRTGAALNLVGAYNEPGPDNNQRITVGAGVSWNGQTHWVEINLYAHQFDWCGTTNRGNPDGLPAGTCDTAGIYDRRSYFGGEIVELTVPGLGNYARLVPGAGWTRYWIDWGELIRAYPWQTPPADWADAEIVGVYVGIESIGRTWAYLQVRDFTTWGM